MWPVNLLSQNSVHPCYKAVFLFPVIMSLIARMYTIPDTCAACYFKCMFPRLVSSQRLY
jgi:hypothetical protein